VAGPDLRGGSGRDRISFALEWAGFRHVANNAVRVAFDCASQREQLYELAQRYEDRRPDLADLCLIRMSELYPHHTILTVDEDDFRMYRRNKRDRIPLLTPPKKKW
jgi:uncharacterized protein